VTEIFLAAAALGALALLALVAVARRTGRGGDAETLTDVFAARRRELAAEADAQGLEAAETAVLEEELALSHLDDAEHDPQAGRQRPAGPPLVPLLAGAFIALLISLGLYAVWGEPNAPLLARTAEIMQRADPVELERLEEVLESRAQRAVNDVNTWFLLGHVRTQMSDYRGAADAFASLHDKAGPNVEVDLAWARASYLADGRTMTDATREIVRRVLAVRPEHPSMLELLAMDAIRRGDLDDAAELLARALRQPMPESRRRLLRESLALVRARLPGNAAAVEPDADPVGEESARLAVSVSLDESLDADAAAPVFVIARDPLQPRPPLAVRRLTAGDLPAEVELTDADAMMPGRSLADLEGVQVLARVSLGGTPSAQSGDLESAVVTVGVGGEPVALRIDRRVP